MHYTLLQYIQFLIKSFRLHGIHSPFVFKFQKNVIQNPHRFYAFDQIDSIRSMLSLSKQKIKVSDYGAGSKKRNNKEKRIDQLLKNSSKPAKYGKLLFRIAHECKADNILELGTSLGLSTAYMALARPKAKVVTVEGCPNIARVAKINFDKLKLDNIQLVVGRFDDELKTILNSFDQLDLIFIDGNHKEEATLNYFEQCLKKCHKNSIMVFDDIHWSKGMNNAWEKIKAHPEVNISIDLFEMGIIFFRKDQAKEHFTIRH